MNVERRMIAAVLGDARADDAALGLAEELGREIVDAGFRLVTGGLGGVMRAASRGARASKHHKPGDVLGILPSYSASDANEFVEIPIATGLNHARNIVVVATADVVFAVGGKSGTLSEMAIAWKLGKPVIVVGDAPGWGARMAGVGLDDRRSDVVEGPLAPGAAVRRAREILSLPRDPPKAFP
jgi:uncharacterized protein (TIGR00725 family)